MENPSILLWILVFFVVFGGGSWVARHIDAAIKHRREVRMRKLQATLPPVPPKPICGCGHDLAFHDPRAGECHSKVKVVSKWERLPDEDGWIDPDEDEVPTQWASEQCPCRRYSGPEPITTLYTPELSPVAVTELPAAEQKEG